jgi:Putative lumazine-binding
MKKQMIKIYFIAITVLIAANTFAQNRAANQIFITTTTDTNMDDKKEIKKTLLKYVKAGDENNVKNLEKVTHENFRIVLNDTKKMEIAVVDRSTYMDLIEKKVFGGTPRKVDIQILDVFGNTNATVKTKLTSEKAIFYNYYSLLKIDGKWWVVQDLLYVEGM